MIKKIGLVGEDPHDTIAIQNLLKQKYHSGMIYFSMLKNKRGDQLENNRAKNALHLECADKNPDIIIFIRDADGTIAQTAFLEKRKNWYKEIIKGLDPKNILLLNIYELEALIFADIQTFNSQYHTSIKPKGNVMHLKEPKELLRKETSKLSKKYAESHCPDLFKLLNIETISQNCAYFRDFLQEFEKLVS